MYYVRDIDENKGEYTLGYLYVHEKDKVVSSKEFEGLIKRRQIVGVVEKTPPTKVRCYKSPEAFIDSILARYSLLKLPCHITLGYRGISLRYLTSINSKLHIPEGISCITSDFYAESLENGLEKITSVSFPNTLIHIEDNAFSSSDLQGELKLPDSLVTLGEYAFDNTAVSSVVIPPNVNSIGTGCFLHCISLKSVKFNTKVNVSLNSGCFRSCILLEEIDFKDADISLIPIGAFSQCKSLRSLVLPDSCKTIGTRAFAGCISLSSLVLPNGLTSLQDNFIEHTIIEHLYVPDSVSFCCADAFAGSSLKSLSLPSSLKDMLNLKSLEGISVEWR